MNGEFPPQCSGYGSTVAAQSPPQVAAVSPLRSPTVPMALKSPHVPGSPTRNSAAASMDGKVGMDGHIGAPPVAVSPAANYNSATVTALPVQAVLRAGGRAWS